MQVCPPHTISFSLSPQIRYSAIDDQTVTLGQNVAFLPSLIPRPLPDYISWCNNDPRPSPDFPPRLRDKIWECIPLKSLGMRLQALLRYVVRFSSFAGSKKWRTHETVFVWLCICTHNDHCLNCAECYTETRINTYKTNCATLNYSGSSKPYTSINEVLK